MKKLGVVSHISRRGRIIVKAESIPKLESEVIDEKSKPVGVVIDLLGPIQNPYVAVKPYSKENLESLVGKVLYLK